MGCCPGPWRCGIVQGPSTGRQVGVKKRATEGSSETPKKDRKGKWRAAVGRRAMRVPMLRRFYVKRMIKYIDKMRAKGKRLPPELVELSRFLSRVPKQDRATALEDAIKAEREGSAVGSRELRRAAAAQQRHSGRGGGRYRPGAPPRSLQKVGGKPPKRQP